MSMPPLTGDVAPDPGNRSWPFLPEVEAMDEVRTNPLVVTVAGTAKTRSVWIRLVGDIDIGGKPAPDLELLSEGG
jgi:hypothetical protein